MAAVATDFKERRLSWWALSELTNNVLSRDVNSFLEPIATLLASGDECASRRSDAGIRFGRSASFEDQGRFKKDELLHLGLLLAALASASWSESAPWCILFAWPD
jgi:hypothetical protein